MSIDDYNKEDLQFLFDGSLKWMREQGEPSVDRDTKKCLYWKPNKDIGFPGHYSGLGCAAAPFINNREKLYAVDLSQSWFTLIERYQNSDEISFDDTAAHPRH